MIWLSLLSSVKKENNIPCLYEKIGVNPEKLRYFAPVSMNLVKVPLWS